MTKLIIILKFKAVAELIIILKFKAATGGSGRAILPNHNYTELRFNVVKCR